MYEHSGFMFQEICINQFYLTAICYHSPLCVFQLFQNSSAHTHEKQIVKSRRNRSTNLRMMPLFPSLQWNERAKQVWFCFILHSVFKAAVWHFMKLLLSERQSEQTVVSRWWQGLCCGLVTHSVVVLWEVVHLPLQCALTFFFLIVIIRN